MKEENVSGVSTPVSDSQAVAQPVPTPVVGTEPVAAQVPVAQQPIQPVQVEQPVQPAIAPAPVAPAPVEVAPAPVAPVPTPVPAPVVETPVVQPAPVQATPISNEGGFGTAQVAASAPAPEMTSVAPVEQPVQTAPVDYNQSLTAAPGTIAPTLPLGDQVGFVATGQPIKEKKSKKGLVAIIVLLVLGGLGALAWFVIVPLVKQALMTPKDVFDATITTISKEITNNIELVAHDKSTYTLEFEIDTNLDTIKDFGGYTYTGKFGLDTSSKVSELGLTIVDKYDTKYSLSNYAKGGKLYERYSTNGDNLLYVGEDTTDWDRLTQDVLTKDEATYLVEQFAVLFKESLDEKYLSKNDASSITVNGETVKASKFTYKIVDENIISTARHFAQGILDDEKLFDIFIKIQASEYEDPTDEDIEELKELFEENLEMMIEEEPTSSPLGDSSIEVSVYTENKTAAFAGIEVVMNGDGEDYKVQYSTLNGSYNLFVYSKAAWDDETVENTIRVDGIKNGNVTNVTVKVDDIDYATLKVTDDNNGGKSIDYEILLENIESLEDYANITGNLTYTTKRDEKKQVDTLLFEIKSGKTYFKVDGKLTTDWTSEVANINTSASTTPSETDLQTIRESFFNELENKTPYGTFTGLLETENHYDDPEPNYIEDTFGETY